MSFMMTIPNVLPDDIDELKAIIASYQSKTAALQHENTHLNERIKELTRQLFGRRSEKLTPEDIEQGRLFDEVEAVCEKEPSPVQTQTVKEYTRKKPGRKAIPDYIPREETVLDVPDHEKVCACGATLVKIGEEVSEKLDVIPAKVVVKKTIRPKYACRACEGTADEDRPAVKCAPLPPQILPKSIATPGLLAYIFISKFCDALPFYRQEKIFSRIGVDYTRQTMSNHAMDIRRIYPHLEKAMWEDIGTYPVLQIDETTVQVLSEPGKKNTSTSYMWAFRGSGTERPLLLFQYAPSRSPHEISSVLNSYRGIIQTDGYQGYDSFGDAGSIVHAACWAHARRYFFEAEKASPGGIASTVLNMIRELYALESNAKETMLNLDAIRTIRQQKSIPILERIKALLDDKVHHVAPKSALGKAIMYACGQWSKLFVYTTDGLIPIDNNAAENMIRPFVIGRKNWLFSGSPGGARASALLYSLIESAKANKLEPYWYLRYLFELLPTTPNDQIKQIMPHHIDPNLVADFRSKVG